MKVLKKRGKAKWGDEGLPSGRQGGGEAPHPGCRVTEGAGHGPAAEPGQSQVQLGLSRTPEGLELLFFSIPNISLKILFSI